MKLVSWDTETFKIAPGMAAPRMVCLQWDDGETSGVVLRDEGLAMVRRWLADPDVISVGQYIAYDLGVVAAEDPSLLPLIVRAIETKRIRCTLMREKLIAIAKGELKWEWDEEDQKMVSSTFDLGRIVYKRLGVFMKKKEAYWRTRYGHLDGVPVEEWPPEAEEYARGDAIQGRAIFLDQDREVIAEGGTPGPDGYAEIPCEILEVKASFALNLMRIWGVRTDAAAVAEFEAEIKAEYDRWTKVALGLKRDAFTDEEWDKLNDDTKEFLARGGAKLMRMQTKKGKQTACKDMKAIRSRVVAHYMKHKIDIPMTDASKKHPHGQVGTDRDTLKNLRHKDVPQDPGLVAVAEVTRWGKLYTTYVPVLKLGVDRPMTPEYNTPIDTLRSSCREPNIQQGPRGTKFRPCFIPRLGWVYVHCDLDTAEMRSLAQVCIKLFGYSTIADAFRAGKDPHLTITAEILERPYGETLVRYEAGDKVVEDARQGNKITNYGCAGGMGWRALKEYARGYGMEMSDEKAQKHHAGFRTAWLEMPEYFNHVGTMCFHGDVKTFVHPITGFVRGEVGYTALCNLMFQHLTAVGAKSGLWRAIKEMYVGEDVFEETADGEKIWLRYQPGALFGCRGWYYGHDEIGMEVPLDRIGAEAASNAADRLSLVMREEMEVWTPDVPAGATAAMSRRWRKGAKPIRTDDGILVPSKPVKQGDRTIWVADLSQEGASRAA